MWWIFFGGVELSVVDDLSLSLSLFLGGGWNERVEK